MKSLSKSRVVVVIVALVLACTSGAESVVAQATGSRPVGLWATGVVGVSSHDIGAAGAVAVRYQRVVLRVRYAHAEELLGDWIYDRGILAGAVLSSSRRFQLAAGAGVGRVGGAIACVLCGSTERPKSTGLLLDLEARWAPTRFFGFSAYTFADFNRADSFGGVGVGLYLGGL